MFQIIDLADLETRERIAGFHGKMIHTEQTSLIFWTVEAGSVLPEHSHPHEQFTAVLEGRLALTIDGRSQVLEAGQVAVIPGHLPHSGRALTACRLLDVFNPARDDYR